MLVAALFMVQFSKFNLSREQALQYYLRILIHEIRKIQLIYSTYVTFRGRVQVFLPPLT